jgi:23S rRNA (uracil1939-C5)-methyltransferase
VIIDIDIESLNSSGDGVARLDGRLITIPFTIPGERVRVRVRRDANRPPAIELLDIIRPSAHRVTPGCRHFGPGVQPGPCGGCSWQHIAYPEQLRLKTALVDAIVRAAAPGAPSARPMLHATPLDDPWHYRHKVHFVFEGRPRRAPHRAATVTMGHYARGSRRVVSVDECPVHAERGNRFAFRLRDAYAKAGVAAATLKSLAIRVGANTSELLATLVVSGDGDKTLRSVTKRVIAREAPTGFHLNIHAGDDGFIFGRETRTIAGSERLRDAVAGTSFLMSPTAFFQTNIGAAEILVRLVLDAIPADVPVLDLYAGAGLFALPLAQRGNPVVAIEENREAVADGEASARLARIPAGRCRFMARRLELALGALAGARAVVLDPPREGCSPAVLDQVFGRLRPGRAVYVSCNPEALDRDIRVIAAHKYKVRSVQPVDMFPHTPHIETVLVFER